VQGSCAPNGLVEPHEHANADDFYWVISIQGMALGAAYGKTFPSYNGWSVMSPVAFLMLVLPAFNVTTQSGIRPVTDGFTTAGSTTMISAGIPPAENSVSVDTDFGGSIPTGLLSRG